MIHKLLFISLLLCALPAQPAVIQRSITIDAGLSGGGTSDWKIPTDITANSGQFSSDAEGDKQTGTAADLDYQIDSNGRDLKTFAYTYDSAFLYLWVERFASISNTTDWWFFFDSSGGAPDGLMQSGEKLLRVSWKGNNGATTVRLYDYVSARPGGDPMTCPASGINSVAGGWCPSAGAADGYDMPGNHGTEITLLAANGDSQKQNGGLTSGAQSGLEMETRISWAALGFAGPASLGFHIASSNGQNIPAGTKDNMDGPGSNGGSILFSDLAVSKVASSTTVNSGSSFSYSVTITNNGSSDASGVTLSDALPAGVSYVSAAASHGSYNPSSGLWTVGMLADQAVATLTLNVKADTVSLLTIVTNTADSLALDQADPDSGNDSDSVDVTIMPTPEIQTIKSVETLSDPVNDSSNPKAIPGAVMQYTITSSNSGFAATDTDSVTVTDSIPANTEMFVGDITGSGSGPLAFIDGGTPSALSYTFTTLGNSMDGAEFSSDGGVTYSYIPVPDAGGFDSNVTHFRGLTNGAFAASNGVNNPSFSFQFRVRVQ
ncbi:MAG: DUF11 domain-containing protein [Gammaproteobacteria bacterium]